MGLRQGQFGCTNRTRSCMRRGGGRRGQLESVVASRPANAAARGSAQHAASARIPVPGKGQAATVLGKTSWSPRPDSFLPHNYQVHFVLHRWGALELLESLFVPLPPLPNLRRSPWGEGVADCASASNAIDRNRSLVRILTVCRPAAGEGVAHELRQPRGGRSPGG